jgi:hypothetical protein
MKQPLSNCLHVPYNVTNFWSLRQVPQALRFYSPPAQKRHLPSHGPMIYTNVFPLNAVTSNAKWFIAWRVQDHQTKIKCTTYK